LNVVQMERVHRSFGKVDAVRTVTLKIEAGEIFGLIGPDGAGKTTLLRMLAGVIAPSSGRITIFGGTPEAGKRFLGYLPQQFSLYEDLTLRENLRFFGGLYDLDRGASARRIAELLEMTGLTEFQDKLAGSLSGGMKQKLAVAAALLHRPRLLLLDEPTTGIDPVFRRELWDLLYHQVVEGLTIIISTPYLDEADRCHRIGMLRHGRLTMINEDLAPAGRWFKMNSDADSRWPIWEWLQNRPEVAEVHFAGQHLRGLLHADSSWEDFVAATLEKHGRQAEATEPDLEDHFLLTAKEDGTDG